MNSGIIEFSLIWLGVLVAPGSGFAGLLKNSLAQTKKTSFAYTVGCVLGFFVLYTLVCIGIGTLVTKNYTAFLIAKWTGITVLAYMAFDCLKFLLTYSQKTQAIRQTSAQQAFTEGFLLNVANPMGFSFFVSSLLACFGSNPRLILLFYEGIWVLLTQFTYFFLIGYFLASPKIGNFIHPYIKPLKFISMVCFVYLIINLYLQEF